CTFIFTVGWGRVYLNCWSLLYIVGEPAPTNIEMEFCESLDSAKETGFLPKSIGNTDNLKKTRFLNPKSLNP
ncbi:MAG: hypothetical protein EAZ18_02290, partial [Oscillatoriales cyanobacterium]